MELKVIVKVSKITNLSDARYCAGMGVHMLGFTVVNGREGYVSPADFQEMRGWFAGPGVVAEIYGLTQPEVLQNIMESYRPDFLEGSLKELELLRSPGVPFLLNVADYPASFVAQHAGCSGTPAYLISQVTDAAALQDLSQHAPVLLQLPDAKAESYLNLPVAGFVLSGTDEERPGLKNYDNLSNILELLEA